MTKHSDEHESHLPHARSDGDAGHSPYFYQAQSGSRLFSLAALIEKVEAQFYLEYNNDSPILREADTTSQRLQLIVGVANYVLAVESLVLELDAKAEVVRRVYSNIFGYGALDALFLDERITTISLEGAEKAAVRYGASVLQSLGAIFDDHEQFKRAMTRLINDAHAELNEGTPVLEAGLMIGERPARISIAAPPFTVALSADIRLHPKSAPTLDELVAKTVLTPDAAELLRAIAASKYGFCIVGEPESGKTTLLNALLPYLPSGDTAIIERAPELRPPQPMKRFSAAWRWEDQAAVTFGEQVVNALQDDPACVVLDEIRSDEPGSIAPLLKLETAPRQIWSIRGVPDAKRLQSALGMLARRAIPGGGEGAVHALYERLPFVITVTRVAERTGDGVLRVFSVAEWQSRVDTDYPDYVMLMQYADGAARRTQADFARWLI
jgi:Flp pilus assembly CpaF family ATPase